MNEHTLGLKIVRIHDGYTELLEINGNPTWAKSVWDIRKDLPVGTNTEEGKTAILLTGIESGTILTMAACIEGRNDDCISAWIFVPCKIEITGKQLVEVLDETKKELIANERNDVKLRQLYSKEYPASNSIKTSIVSSGEKFAYRKYGKGSGYELYELLSNPDQADYRHYRGVFLIDSAIWPSMASGIDLTASPLKEFVTIEPVKYINGFQPFINNQSLTSPISLPEGDEVTIVWKRNGYKTVEKKWTVRKGESVPTISDSDFKMRVDYDLFEVRDKSTGKQIRDFDIRLNNTPLEEGKPLYVPESYIRSCRVYIEATGYEAINKEYDLKKERIYIHLDRKKYTHDLKVVLPYSDYEYADLHLVTDFDLKGRSPIAGYVRDRHNPNYLVYKPQTPQKLKILGWLLLAISLLIGFCGGCFVSDLLNNRTKTETKSNYSAYGKADSSSSDAALDSSKKSNSMSRVVDYLDSHEVWKKQEMDDFPAIKELWDAINNRDFEKILSYEVLLKDSDVFQKLINAINENKHKKFQKYTDGTEIAIGDKEKGYIKKLYDAEEPAKKKSSNGSHSSSTSLDEQSDF